jgi:Family of unknown function (DUF6152)
MRKRVFACLLGCSLLSSELPALAHHSFSAVFDDKKPLKLTGTVTKLEWQNPHTWFYMDVKDDTGKTTNWGMEMGSPNLLIRSGWNRNSMKIGDQVTIEGFRARDGSNNGNAQIVILTNTGQRLFTASSVPQPAAGPKR